MSQPGESARARDKRRRAEPYVQETTESIQRYLDTGPRAKALTEVPSRVPGEDDETFRVRSGPTRSERLNRALSELGPSAFKIHQLLWTWRGAPARGKLPYYTIHSLGRFCNLTRPTVRKALLELSSKGWIEPADYNIHFKNAIYRLVAIRKIPLAPKEQIPVVQKT